MCGACLNNFSWTWGEQRTFGAWKGHSAHPVLFVLFWFVANGMQTICRWRSACSQSHPHICALVRAPFGASCIRGFTYQTVFVYTVLLGSALSSSLLYFNGSEWSWCLAGGGVVLLGHVGHVQLFICYCQNGHQLVFDHSYHGLVVSGQWKRRYLWVIKIHWRRDLQPNFTSESKGENLILKHNKVPKFFSRLGRYLARISTVSSFWGPPAPLESSVFRTFRLRKNSKTGPHFVFRIIKIKISSQNWFV